MHVLNKLGMESFSWCSWCRLCAKEEDSENSISILSSSLDYSTTEETKITLKEALEKYFWVQSSIEDILPKNLCCDCFSLVSSIINFNERVERVQQMYNFLVETPLQDSFDLRSIRLKFDVSDDDRKQWFPPQLTIPAVIGIDGKVKVSEIRQNAHECETSFTISIKQESMGVDSRQTPNEKYAVKEREYHRGVDQEEMIYDGEGAANDSQEDEEDPFDTMTDDCEEKQNDESSEEDDIELEGEDEESLNKLEAPSHNDNTELSKRKRKRRKRKDRNCKKRDVINTDFPLNGTCKECGENFRLYSTCCEHMKQKHGMSNEIKQWKCPSCDRILQSWYNFERHMRIHMPVEERKTKKCLECDARFTSKAQLEAHINYKHKNSKPFICEECGLCLRTNSNLRQHMLIHTDIKPFECEVCKKKFKNNSRLKIHMDTHSPNKHVCAICGLQLNSRATLNRHFLVHSDDMQHKCDYCGRAFKRAKALKNHLLLHTGLKPYSCEFCDRTFANGSNCRSHMKKLHPEELTALEASGNKTHAKNIPKLETLKAVTKAADNLTPVVTKFSGCFAFGKKPKILSESDKSKTLKPPNKSKKLNALQKVDKSSKRSDSLPLVGNTNLTRTPAIPQNNLQGTDTTSQTSIPNFDNIYQHLIMKNNPSELQIKRPPSSLSQSSAVNDRSRTPHHPFYNEIHSNMMGNSATASQHNDDLVRSPESDHDSMTPLIKGDHSNASSPHTPFYGAMRTTLPHGNFI